MTTEKKRSMNKISFKIMSFLFRIRDIFSNPMKKIEKAEIKKGENILDYGCGPGSYSIAAAKKVGETGKVYSVDILSEAIELVERKAKKKNLSNISTLKTDCKINLPNKSIDKIIFFDTFAMLTGEKQCIIRELHRVLKKDGILSMDDHHLTENEIINEMTKDGLFSLNKKIDDTFNFKKKLPDKKI